MKKFIAAILFLFIACESNNPIISNPKPAEVVAVTFAGTLFVRTPDGNSKTLYTVYSIALHNKGDKIADAVCLEVEWKNPLTHETFIKIYPLSELLIPDNSPTTDWNALYDTLTEFGRTFINPNEKTQTLWIIHRLINAPENILCATAKLLNITWAN